MPDEEQQKITEQAVVAQLEELYGEWVIKRCWHRGEPGVMFKTQTGQLFVIAVHEVSGIIVT